MTKLLERAISEVSKLPEEEQDALASVIMEEMVAGKQWTRSFSNSQDFVEEMVEEAEKEYEAGETRDLQWESPLPSPRHRRAISDSICFTATSDSLTR